MASEPCRWAVVPAAGYGQRFAQETCEQKPKQYFSILGQSAIEHSLHAILRACPGVRIMVAVAEADPYWSQLAIAAHPQIHTVQGGRERSDSVLAGLSALQGLADSEDWVLVHDAARPCVATEDIASMLTALQSHKVGGVMSVPAVDTLKQIDSDGHVAKTLDRRFIHQAQTPQIFRYELLRHALRDAVNAGVAVSDESSAVERMGHKVLLHKGRLSNIKLTYSDDVAAIEATLRRQSEEASE
ncbi:MAG: 2-C-methyl-D-erythritol 4-phosphate cytidylyltransferase [Pseudomonadota bacterium]